MASTNWRWRTVPAAAGVAAYPLLVPTDWSNPYLLLYDVPTLVVACGFAGAILQAVLRGETRKSPPRLGILAAATLFAWGAQYRSWPLSGHLTIALTAGTMEAGDRGSPAWLRAASLLPAVLLVLIRTYKPQSVLMGNHANTVTALLLGATLGVLGLVASRRGQRKE